METFFAQDISNEDLLAPDSPETFEEISENREIIEDKIFSIK